MKTIILFGRYVFETVKISYDLPTQVVHLNGRQQVFLTIFWFDRLKTSTSGAESSKPTQQL